MSAAGIEPAAPAGASVATRPPRVLILTTDIGEGHDLPARQLALGIAEECPGAEVEIVDGLDEMGPVVVGVLKGQAQKVMSAPTWVYDIDHWLAIRFRPTSWLGRMLTLVVGGPRLLRYVRSRRPDVVVSTYPGCTFVLGPLRRLGYLGVPFVSAITDLAELRYWAWPGVDLHLITHPESESEVRAIAGPTEVAWVHGLTSPGFTLAPDAAAGRAEFALPDGAPAIVVSGGGWGVGDLASAVEESLAAPEEAHVVVLCGRNEDLRTEMESRFGADPRVHVSGFTNRMNELFAAADVLVHSTAGLTVLEAHIRGCRVISYGWGAGHIKANNHAFERYGIARVARTRAELARALADALREPKHDTSERFAALPSAASAVLATIAPKGPA